MATKELKSVTDVRQGLYPAALTTGSSNGLDVDTRGFESALFTLQGDTAFAGTLTIQEGDSTTAYSDAGSDDVYGTQGVSASAGSIKSLAYTGSKRYARAVVVTTTAGDASVACTLGLPHVAKTDAN